jgi:hypothetical protein
MVGIETALPNISLIHMLIALASSVICSLDYCYSIDNSQKGMATKSKAKIR